MDGDLWASRMSATRRNHSHQALLQPHLDRALSLDDLESDEGLRPDFTCPFCFEEFDITTLCSHLDDEHCYDSRSVVCPVCAAKVGNDMVGHIMLQHGHLLKMQRRRRFRKAGAPFSSTFSLLGKELREANLQALLEGYSSRLGSSTSTVVSEPFLSSLACSYSIPKSDALSKGTTASEEASAKSFTSTFQRPSLEDSVTAEEWEKKLEEATVRAKFVQNLLLSMIFNES